MKHRFGLLTALMLAWGCGPERPMAPATPPAAAASQHVAAPSVPQSAPPTAPAAPTVPAASPPAPERKREPNQVHLDHAQPKLRTLGLYVGAKEVDAEVCLTITEIATGLMFRQGIGPDDGMLFVFGRPHRTEFYMKNVDFDIAAAYIDPEGVIQEVVQLKKRVETPVPAKSDNIQFVLETAPDFFTRNGIGPGTLIRTKRGTLKETFNLK